VIFGMGDGMPRVAAVLIKLIQDKYKELSAMIEEEDTK
jgi:hypothetical protein